MPLPPRQLRTVPECVRLGVRPGYGPSARPPVRIFLGTEPAQYRAERVFVWSIEQVRDPSRVYEIYLMKSLAGFRTAGWTTGFTNYRFAIPHFAGRTGRAIYNDVDQIYLRDPAELFDQDLGPHALLAVAPNDLSVMVLDCARMAAIWTLESAQRESKRELTRKATRIPGLVGPLAAEWNLRDEEITGRPAGVFHYTTLHTQPWRPFPRRFVYQDNPYAGAAWHALERSADAAGFCVFTREHPSSLFNGTNPDAVESVNDDDLLWVLAEHFRAASAKLDAHVRSNGVRTADWWIERFERAAASHPQVPWEIHLDEGANGTTHRGGPWTSTQPPRVWVLTDDRPGNTTQAVGLADALGWPYERKRLHCGLLSVLHNRLLGASLLGIDLARSSPLAPPWPDLVIAAGRRTAPVARWIAEQSRGQTRIVALGRKAADRAADVDLAVTPLYARLFPHPQRLEISAPFHSVTDARLAAAAPEWRERFASFPRPRIALLVGGDSGQYFLDANTARHLGTDVMRFAGEAGGSVLATTSRRTGEAAADALCGALTGAYVHRWTPNDRDNPYLGLLALADAFVITGDSESMLAEAVSRGVPVYIYPLPVRRRFRFLRVGREWIVNRAHRGPLTDRGTPRPQRGLEYWCAWLIDQGFVRPTRDLDLLHADLIRRSLARPFGTPYAPPEPAPKPDLSVVVTRVRALMGAATEENRAQTEHQQEA